MKKNIRRFIRKIDGSNTILARLGAIERKLDRLPGNMTVSVAQERPRAVREESANFGALEKALLGRLSADEYQNLGISLERIYYMLDRVESVVAGSLSDERTKDPTMSYEKLVRDIEAMKPKVNALFALYKAIDASRVNEAVALLKMQASSIERSDFGKYRDHFADSRADFHIDRYRFAASFAYGKDVLDIACGTGYGSQLIGELANKVLGVDISKEAIDFAQKHYVSENVKFRRGEISSVKKNENFDLIASFETVEHLADPEAFVAGIKSHLRDNGQLVVSVPNDWQDLDINPNHKTNFDAKSFDELLKKEFGSIKYYRQNSGSPERKENHNRARALVPVDNLSGLESAECIVAVCRTA